MNTKDWLKTARESTNLIDEWVRLTLINGLQVDGVLVGVGNNGVQLLPKDANTEVQYSYRLIGKIVPYEKPPPGSLVR